MVTRKSEAPAKRSFLPQWAQKEQDGTGTNTPQYTRRKRQGDWFGGMLLFAQLLAAALTVWLIWQSVEVYVQIGVKLADGTINASMPKWLGWVLTHTWILGDAIAWFLHGGVALVSVAAMLILYTLLQIGEVAPIMLENSPRTLRRLIGSIMSHTRLAIKKDDHATVAFLKERHNAIPTKWVDSIYTAKWICYGIDFLICLLACPPIRGGWERLRLVMAAPTMGDFDFVNAAKLGITLFAVEVGFFVYLWIKRGRTILNTPDPTTDQATEA